MSTTMFSKFPGTCTSCGCRFPQGAEIIYVRGVGAKHSTPGACVEAKKIHLADLAQREANAPKLPLNASVHPILEFLKAAQDRGLKSPKLRVLAPKHLNASGTGELRMSLTKSGAAPGSLAIVIGGNYYGAIRPDGRMTQDLAKDIATQKYLLVVAENPINAAKEYAALMGLCSFCGKELTDAGSVEVGYGPVCASHWGLPHKPQGTPQVGSAPQNV